MNEGAQEAQTAERRTSLYDRHVAAGARMVPFAGYSMPVQYRSVVEEHHAVRRAAGLFDVSHMGELVVRGPDALAEVQALVTNDLSRLADGRAQYNLLLDGEGGMLDDLLVYRFGAEEVMLVVNAACRERDREWIAGRVEGCEVIDRSDEVALIAVQGPASPAALAPLCPLDLDRVRYYSFAPTEILGGEVVVSRTGYTGEDGFELYLDADRAPALWDALLDSGEPHGVRPAGLGARDTLRLEAGMLLAGQDFDDSTNPYEVGLGWAVKLDAAEFCGREALRTARAVPLRRRLVAFELEERGIARPGHTVAVGEPALSGPVTSGSWSPTLERAIGLAMLSSEDEQGAERPAVGTPLQAIVRGRSLAGRVAERPFYRREK